jgi:transcriptional regulator with XRE-family HTH domain
MDETDYQIKIPMKLRGVRAERRLNQADIATALGKNQKTIANWENGDSFPTLDIACKLADLYGVSLDRLAGREVQR